MSLTVYLDKNEGFVGNPIFLVVNSSTDATFEIVDDDRLLYSGTGTGSFVVNISEILESSLIPGMFPVNNLKDVIIPAKGYNGVSFNIVVYNSLGDRVSSSVIAWLGGISNRDLRYLYNDDSSIFNLKFHNPNANFFFTTRSLDWCITMKETELYPLLFIFPPSGEMTIEDELTKKAVTIEGIKNMPYGLNIEAVRFRFFNDYKILPSCFNIKIDDFACRICIEQSDDTKDIFRLRFLNSFGSYELLEVIGPYKIKPTLSDDGESGNYKIYDFISDSFINRRSRQKIESVITVNTGYKRTEELYFLHDLLSSQEVYFIDKNGGEIPVFPEIIDFEYENKSIEPMDYEIILKPIERNAFRDLNLNSTSFIRQRVHVKEFTKQFN